MNYAIFRSKPIFTLKDLAGIGSHNKREKKVYNSNPDINLNLSKNNIDIVPLNNKYVKGFYELTKDYKHQHEQKMKTEREDRKRTYRQTLDKSKNVVADELLFTATHDFFDDMSEEDILKWADTCMEFVYKDLGYTKSQILHAVIHLDEETPHIHCVVVPLVKKYDKRSKEERFTISKKQYIKNKNHLSLLQDKYYERLINKGFDLERGIKGSDNEHQSVRDFKKTTSFYEKKVDSLNKNIDSAMNDFKEKSKTTKNILFDKKHVLVEKETFDSMNKVIDETKKAMEFQPKIETLFNKIDNFTKSHQSLEREVNILNNRNNQLLKENDKLKNRLKSILMAFKQFLRKLLQIGNETIKDVTTSQIKNNYDDNNFDKEDIYHISKETTKEDELFDYAEIPSYYKTRSKNKNKDELER